MEKMAGVGQLSAAIVHEIKNIMARIKGAAYVIVDFFVIIRFHVQHGVLGVESKVGDGDERGVDVVGFGQTNADG